MNSNAGTMPKRIFTTATTTVSVAQANLMGKKNGPIRAIFKNSIV